MPSNIDHVVVYQDAAAEWRWRAVAGNGEIVATSEGYTRHEDAVRAAQASFGESVRIRHDEAK